mmetsp:Transcript_53272/g.155179  ORF Transcript_53272/g.155179 Transcript_53272/m.155179 type:complete len:453 (+) Transcript_53272:43-1401(+)
MFLDTRRIRYTVGALLLACGASLRTPGAPVRQDLDGFGTLPDNLEPAELQGEVPAHVDHFPKASQQSVQLQQDVDMVDVSPDAISEAEMDGQEPVHIDTFMAASRQSVNIILLTKLLHAKAEVYDRLAAAKWQCAWNQSSRAPTGVDRKREGRVVLHNRRKPVTGQSLVADAHRHTLIVQCDVPEDLQPGGKLSVSISAKYEQKNLYSRNHIRVRKQSLFNDATTALCTMVIADASASPHLTEWVRYHLNVGFQQIVVYVEDKDPSWVWRYLHEFRGSGRVRVVHFYFGPLSDARAFKLQQAQELHCLYQAKGRVPWLGHADIDEYFEIRTPDRNLMKLLQRRHDSSAVMARSQFWSFSKGTHHDAGQVPCDMTCKQPGYFGNGQRSKLIMNTHRTLYYSVHMLTRASGRQYVADPDSELRLNHFKHMSPAGEEGCSEDLTFRAYCQQQLST